MIPINDKEEKTAAEKAVNEAAEKAAYETEVAADQQEIFEPVVPEEELNSDSETGEAEDGSGSGETEEEEDTAEKDGGTANVGPGGLKGAFLNRKQKKEEKKTEKELEKLKKDLADKEKEMAVLNDKYLRICAEYDNFRKRSQKEKEGLYGDIRSNVITGFLPVFDNLERALAAHTEDEAYAKGVEMIMNQFNKTLEKLGVEEIPSLGQTFDPTIHNAVMHVDDETKGENEIVDVFQKGFKIGDKIIRFSMVKVAN